MVILLIRGSILGVTGYRNAPPNPCAMLWSVPAGFFCHEKIMFLEISDMYLFVFDIFNQYLVITLLIQPGKIAVTVTDSGNQNQFVKQLIRWGNKMKSIVTRMDGIENGNDADIHGCPLPDEEDPAAVSWAIRSTSSRKQISHVRHPKQKVIIWLISHNSQQHNT
jgi:hypothetical protein